MPRLASISKFAEHFNTTPDAEVSPTIARALDLATFYISDALECDFGLKSVVDHFTVTARTPRIAETRMVLRLSQGFLASSPSPVLSARPDPSLDLAVADASTYTIDSTKGLVVVDEYALASLAESALQPITTPSRWDFTVAFTHGFDSEADGTLGMVYLAVPADLIELCVLQAVEVYEKLVEEKEPTFTVLKNSHALDRFTRFHAARTLPYHTSNS